MARFIAQPFKRVIFVLFLGCLLNSGCVSQRLIDPPSTFKDLREQEYPFQVVWEVAIEAMTTLKFRVKRIEKDSDVRTAVVVSNMNLEEPVLFEGEEYGRRIYVEISAGDKGNLHRFKVAASRWVRFVDPGSGASSWKPAGTAPGLHDEYEAALERQFSKRYIDKPS